MTPAQFPVVLPARSSDDLLKQRAHLAFLAYEAAVRSGDAGHAQAARQRFLAATAHIGGRRRMRP
jgi:hypothetical protein